MKYNKILSLLLGFALVVGFVACSTDDTEYYESIKNSKIASVKALADDIRLLALSDVENGVITVEEYEQYLGEAYPTTVVSE